MSSLEYFNNVINEVEEKELLHKNYVEYLRIFCPLVGHNNGKTENKEFYMFMREEAYIQKLEVEVKVLKWYIKQLNLKIKHQNTFYKMRSREEKRKKN